MTFPVPSSNHTAQHPVPAANVRWMSAWPVRMKPMRGRACASHSLQPSSSVPISVLSPRMRLDHSTHTRLNGRVVRRCME